MKLKFCGLTRKADIEAANEVKPDFIGFVFAESRRHVSDMDAARLKEHLDPEIKAVGVFVTSRSTSPRWCAMKSSTSSSCTAARACII